MTRTSSPPSRPLRIILAEDDDELRSFLTLVLARAGHAVVALEDGLELSDYISLTQCCGGPLQAPDLIVSDLQMPGRSGLETLERLLASGVTCPVVLLSAFTDEETRKEAQRLGVRRVLDKPVDVEELRGTVREVTSHPYKSPGISGS
jgi:DNA-binding response OmpR family regulator